jgi:hypothetical protein
MQATSSADQQLVNLIRRSAADMLYHLGCYHRPLQDDAWDLAFKCALSALAVLLLPHCGQLGAPALELHLTRLRQPLVEDQVEVVSELPGPSRYVVYQPHLFPAVPHPDLSCAAASLAVNGLLHHLPMVHGTCMLVSHASLGFVALTVGVLRTCSSQGLPTQPTLESVCT